MKLRIDRADQIVAGELQICTETLYPVPGHPPVVDQALEIGADVIWMQLGVTHDEAAIKARERGVTVIMDKCIKQEHEKRQPF